MAQGEFERDHPAKRQAYHIQSVDTQRRQEPFGIVGDVGNAKGPKAPGCTMAGMVRDNDAISRRDQGRDLRPHARPSC
jgi:hypothetical protein